MARFAFVGPSYTSQSLTADAEMTKNFYVEQVESGQGKSQFVLYPTPGSTIFLTLPTSPIRKNGFLAINGRFFAVGGNTLYEVFANGAYLARGIVGNDNLPVSMAAAQVIAGQGTPQLAVVSAGSLYVLNLLTNAMTIPAGPVGTPFQIVYADGFYVLLNTNGVFQFSIGLDATNWPGIETEAVSSYPDQTLAITAAHRELWLFSALKGVTYYDAGDQPIPYDQISGGDMEQGIAAPWSLLPLDNTVFWLGANVQGAGIFWRASGYTPLRISNHAVEYAMQGYPTITDCVTYGYQDQGHTFMVAYFPTANKTWVYDCATQMWHEREYWNATTGQPTAHRSCCHAYVFGMHLVGDWQTGNIYQQSIAQTMDFGNVIRRIRRAPHIANEDEWMFYHSLQVIAETGLTPSQLLPGNAVPTVFTLQDMNLAYWDIRINDLGAFTSTPSANTNVNPMYFSDMGGTTSWKLGVSIAGAITTTPVLYDTTYPTFLNMFSAIGGSEWQVTLTNIGVLQTSFVATVYRNPTMNLRWSNDGAHTWSNYYPADTGTPGNYKARTIWRRLGRSKDRVFEVEMTDPIPWRLIDAYLKASPGYVPTERITDRVRKMA